MSSNKKILDKVSSYYTEKLNQHGCFPRGVDWNSKESQFLRFEQLCKLLPNNSQEHFSILDYGCGYGAMYEYISNIYPNVSYTGYDISKEMITKAKNKFPQRYQVSWITQIEDNYSFDYVIASGIFNVKLNEIAENWYKYILDTVTVFNNIALKGFSFNCLTSFSDKKYMKENLYYANPMDLFSYCKTNFSKYVTLLHDYPIHEFCILIKKNNFYE